MRYKLWRVYGVDGTEFYVVNTTSRKVQSSWKCYLTASGVCSKLNGRR